MGQSCPVRGAGCARAHPRASAQPLALQQSDRPASRDGELRGALFPQAEPFAAYWYPEEFAPERGHQSLVLPPLRLGEASVTVTGTTVKKIIATPIEKGMRHLLS